MLAVVLVLAGLAGCTPSASSFTGTWGEGGQGKPSLTIKDDGTFSGNDGCNAMKGKGTVSGDTFTFGPFATTQMACEGVHPWLNLANTAKINGNVLVVHRTDGTKIGSLNRN